MVLGSERYEEKRGAKSNKRNLLLSEVKDLSENNMHYIRLITGNKKKVSDYMRFIDNDNLHIEFLPLSVPLPELQEEDMNILMSAKVEVAKCFSSSPFCIDDASFWSLRYP